MSDSHRAASGTYDRRARGERFGADRWVRACICRDNRRFQQQRPQEPPCYREFAPLKAEAEKRGLAVKNATERKDKAPREEVCTLLKRYSEAEGAI